MVKTFFSANLSAREAVSEIAEGFSGISLKSVLFFASWESYNPHEISALMKGAFPEAEVFGCSSKSEICNGFLKNSIVAMAFDGDAIEGARIEVIENLSENVDVSAAFKSFEDFFGISMAAADYRQYCGIMLVDGLCHKEEELMDKIGDATNIMFVGASASDSFKFQSTYVYANGKAYADAALLALLKPRNSVDYIKTQNVSVTDKVLTVTKANMDERLIYEFNGKPAAKAYAEALGKELPELEASFFAHPLGLVIGDDVYLRSPQRIEGGAIKFYCGVAEGMDLRMCDLEDMKMLSDMKAILDNKKERFGKISGIIEFQGAFRTAQLESEKKELEYASLFEGIPTIGFSTYGEQYLGHMNQTSAMIFFK